VAPVVVAVEASVDAVRYAPANGKGGEWRGCLPCCQHLDQVLLGCAGLVAPAQAREDAVLLEQGATRGPLDLHHLRLLDAGVRRDDVEVQVLAEDDDARPVLQHLLGRPGHGLDGYRVGFGAARGRVRPRGDRLRDVAEELQHVLERHGVVLARDVSYVTIYILEEIADILDFTNINLEGVALVVCIQVPIRQEAVWEQ
jgi:hypothetical protein